jgi:hypothetical protein
MQSLQDRSQLKEHGMIAGDLAEKFDMAKPLKRCREIIKNWLI